MEITRIAQKTKTLSLCSTKRLFKFLLNKFVIISSLFLFSCSNYLIQAEEIKPEAVKCGVSRTISETNHSETLTIKNKKFKKRLIEIGLDKTDVDYNLFVSIGLRGVKGYQLKLDKIMKDKWRNRLNEKNSIRVNNKDKKLPCDNADTKKTFIKTGTNTTGRVNFLSGKGKRKKYLGVVVK